MANSTWVDEDSGTVYYTASALGACSKGLYYDRLGVTGFDPPEKMQAAYDRGSRNEESILALLEDKLVWRRVDKSTLASEGWRFGSNNVERGVDYSDQIRVLARIRGASDSDDGLPSIYVPAHCDAMLVLTFAPVDITDRRGERRGAEVKCFGDAFWKKFKKEGLAGFPKYQAQVSAQMIGAGAEVGSRWMKWLFVVGHHDGGPDGKVTEIAWEEVDTPPMPWGRIRSRILDIESAVERKVPPACEIPLQYPCPFFTYHDKGEEDSGGGSSELPDGERKILDAAAAQYELGKAKEDEGKVLKAGASRVLAELFDRMQRETLQVNRVKYRGVSYEVTDMVVERKGGIDEGKLVEAGVNPDDVRKPGTTSRWPKIAKVKS